MKVMRWFLVALSATAISSQCASRAQAGTFKMDFGTLQNVNEDGERVDIPGWDEFSTFCLIEDTPVCYDANDPSIEIFPVFPDGKAVFPLTDYAASGDNDVKLQITDNERLTTELGIEPANAMVHNNPVPQFLDVKYDGVDVPTEVKDDYMYRQVDAAGSELLFRWENLNPGKYNVTMFMGRTNDNGQFAKVWVDSDPTGKNEPAEENTGDFAGSVFDEDQGIRVETPEGNPKTVAVEVKAGQYLFYAHMEDNQGGISGIIVRQTEGVGGLVGDFNANQTLDAGDIDALSAVVRAGSNTASFDLTGDNKVNSDDREQWVNVVKKTYFGDADLNGEFNSGDFVAVFGAGEYEDGVASNSGWADGDWDGNGDFDSGDFVAAFSAGGYELGPRAAVSAVPEPSALLLFALGGLGLIRRRK